eukprot:140979_1
MCPYDCDVYVPYAFQLYTHKECGHWFIEYPMDVDNKYIICLPSSRYHLLLPLMHPSLLWDSVVAADVSVYVVYDWVASYSCCAFVCSCSSCALDWFVHKEIDVVCRLHCMGNDWNSPQNGVAHVPSVCDIQCP